MELRPRFRLSTPLSKEEVIAALREGLQKRNNDELVGSWSHGHIMIYLPQQIRKAWSPHLDISIEEEGEKCLLRCLMAPAPGIWTLFMFLYFGFGTLGLFGLMFGLSQWQLDKFPWALIASPVLFLLVGGLYLVAHQGQKLANHDMHLLKGFLTNNLANYREIPKEDW